jgi:hypothetical protein
MQELAVFEIPPELMPLDLRELQTALENAGLHGEYRVMDDMLAFESGRDRLLFDPQPAVSAGDLSGGPCIEVAARVEDEVATLIDLAEIFQEAFPGCQGSSAWGDEL